MQQTEPFYTKNIPGLARNFFYPLVSQRTLTRFCSHSMAELLYLLSQIQLDKGRPELIKNAL